MLIQVQNFFEVYKQIIDTSHECGQTTQVIIFVPLTVDSLAAAAILSELFKKDDVGIHFVPVRGYKDLEEQIQTRLDDEALPPTMIFINCGGSISLLRQYTSAMEVSIAYVVDSHRPIHFENLDSRNERVKVFDDSQSLFDQICLLPDSELDEEESIVIEANQKIKNGTRFVRKSIDQNSPEAQAYVQTAHFSDPASLQLYTFVGTTNHTSLNSLWFAILGLTDHFLLDHIDMNRYESLFNALLSEASRLTGGVELFTTYNEDDVEVVTPNSSITVPVSAQMYIKPCVDLRCNLMRHWTLYESISNSTFFATRLRLWYIAGNDRLQLLLAKMGVPLRDANTSFITMSNDIRENLVKKFDQWADRFALTGVAFPSFMLKHGFAAPLAASDIVMALRARLLVDANFKASFVESFKIMRMTQGDAEVLSDGVNDAKNRSKLVVSIGIDLMNRKNAAIANIGPFRITYIHNATERNLPIEPSYLIDLGQFLIQAFREDEEDVLPMVIGALDQPNQMWTVVAVSTGFEFGEVEASKFGTYFVQAAANAEIAITMDSFDSFVCQVPDELLHVFIDQLTLLVIKEFENI